MIRKQMVQPLETERLQLRGWKRSDAPQLYAYASNPNVGPKAGWKPHESIAESRKIIETVFRESRVWAIIEKTGGRIIGSIGLSEDRLRNQVKEMKKQGLGGFFMHARVGLKTPYMQKEWFQCVKSCIEEAKKYDIN